jgi:hypothetical protein
LFFRFVLLSAAMAAAVPAIAQPQPPSMSVATFLGKAESLRKRGPLAMLSGDLKLVMNQIQADGASLKSERESAKAAGRPAAYCPPEGGIKLGQKELMEAMEAVPAAQRAQTTTGQALRAYFVRRFPCPRP